MAVLAWTAVTTRTSDLPISHVLPISHRGRVAGFSERAKACGTDGRDFKPAGYALSS